MVEPQHARADGHRSEDVRAFMEENEAVQLSLRPLSGIRVGPQLCKDRERLAVKDPGGMRGAVREVAERVGNPGPSKVAGCRTLENGFGLSF